jgi:hypothetical protein
MPRMHFHFFFGYPFRYFILFTINYLLTFPLDTTWHRQYTIPAMAMMLLEAALAAHLALNRH